MDRRSNRSNKGRQARAGPKEREMEVDSDRDQVDTRKAHVSVNTRRQRNLEINKEIERDRRHRARSRESVPSSPDGAEPEMLEIADSTHSKHDNSSVLLNNTTLSDSSLSAGLQPVPDKNNTVRLWASLPHGHDRQFKGYLDHGTWTCLVSQKLVDRFQLHVHRVKEPMLLKGLSRYPEKSSKLTKLKFRFDSYPRVFKVWCWILDKKCMDNDIVLGRKFLERKLGFETNKAWKMVTGASWLRRLKRWWRTLRRHWVILNRFNGRTAARPRISR